MQIDDDYVYWLAQGFSGTNIRRNIKSGSADTGTTETVMSGLNSSDAQAMAVDDTHVYVVESKYLKRINKSEIPGGEVKSITTTMFPLYGIALDSTDIYLVSGTPSSGKIERINKTSGVLDTLESMGTVRPTFVTVDDDSYYWVTEENLDAAPAQPNQVWRRPKDQSAAASLVYENTGGKTTRIVPYGSNIYLSDKESPFGRVPKHSQAALTVLGGSAWHLAVDSHYVYYTISGSNRLYRVPK